jgi:hypothetical protein
MPIIPQLLKAKFDIPEDQLAKLGDLDKQLDEEFRKLGSGAAAAATKTEEVKVVA